MATLNAKMLATAAGCSLVTFAASPSAHTAQAATAAKPDEVVKNLFAAIERGDEVAITSLMASNGSLIEQEIPAPNQPCRLKDCTYTMTVRDFSSGVGFLAPLNARYKLSKAKTNKETSSISTPYSFTTPADATRSASLYKCGDATFTLVKANGRWLISGFTYTNQIERSRCKFRD